MELKASVDDDLPNNFPDVNWSSRRVSTAAIFCLLMYLLLLLALILVKSFLDLRD